ncbi:MAG: class I SAM-dependent methyltransferase [Clostridia bacterium]|nr:class I SAM-dependent methyltransferase [Clostridia bacterium]
MEAKEIAVQFNGIAKKYDENRRKFIPCFDDFYFGATRFLADCISRPKSVLDLGAGTGLLSYYWYGCFPDSRYTLVDIAEDMLQIAKERFLGLENVNFEFLDYSLGLPKQEFDVVISALSIHHLENDEKDKLFKNIYDKLPSGGIFVNYDQFCAGSETLNRWYDTYWESLLLCFVPRCDESDNIFIACKRVFVFQAVICKLCRQGYLTAYKVGRYDSVCQFYRIFVAVDSNHRYLNIVKFIFF